MRVRIRIPISPTSKKPRPRNPLSLDQFDGRVNNDDVVASDREPRWNGKRLVGACWCNGLVGARQARLAGEQDTSLAGLMGRGSGASDGSDGVRWLSCGRSESFGRVEANVRPRPQKEQQLWKTTKRECVYCTRTQL